MDTIGKGPYGQVFKIHQKGLESKVFAAKIYTDINTDKEAQNVTNITREIDILSKVSHPAIVKFIGFSNKDFENQNNSTIIMEYATNGSLDRTDIFTKFNSTQKLILIYGIASALACLHSHSIIHRDLKPSNILLNDKFYPLVSDFGMSEKKLMKYPDFNYSQDSLYLAPEIKTDNFYTKSCDVYSFSIIMYQLLTEKKTEIKKNEKINFPGFKDRASNFFMNLINKCWSDSPSDRPSFDEIVESLSNGSNFSDSVDMEKVNEYVKYIDFHQEKNEEQQTLHFFETNEAFSSEKEKVSEQESSSEIDNKCNNNDNNENSVYIIFNSEYNQKIITQDQIGEEIELIAKGNYGEVFKVFLLNDERKETPYAAKVLYMDFEDYPASARKAIWQHMIIVQQFNFPSILKVHEYKINCNFDSENRQAILTNYCPNGSLAQVISNNKLTKTKKLINIYGIAMALCYLHKYNYLHFDLKASTILEDENFYPKLSDIGFSKCFYGLKEMRKVHDFSPYMAPEVLMGEKYTKKSDVYSFGLIVYEIITCDFPFKYNGQYELCKLICNGLDKNELDKAKPYSELIGACLNKQANERPDFESICETLRNDTSYLNDDDEKNEYIKYVDAVDKYITEYKCYDQKFVEDVNYPNVDEKKPKKAKKKAKKKTKKKKKCDEIN